MNNEWNEIGEDEVTRALGEGLRDEANQVPIPDRYDELVAAGHRRSRRWLPVVAVLVLVLGTAGLLGVSRLFTTGSRIGGTPAPVATRPTPPAQISGEAISFVSDNGTIECVMGGSRAPDGVECHLTAAAAWGSSHPCDAAGRQVAWSHDYGIVTLSNKGARTACNGQGFDELRIGGSQAKPYTSWYDPAVYQSRALPGGGQAPVLPYGTTAVVGQNSCRLNTTGITCTRAEVGFRLSTQNLVLRSSGNQVVYGAAAFATPNGEIICSVGDQVDCEVPSFAYTPPTKPVNCAAGWGSWVALREKAQFICGDAELATRATVGSDQTSWWDDAQPQVGSSGKLAVVRYRTEVINGSYRCSVTEAGVNCGNVAAKAGFALTRARYQLI